MVEPVVTPGVAHAGKDLFSQGDLVLFQRREYLVHAVIVIAAGHDGDGGLVSVDGRLFGASSRGVAKGWLTVDGATGTPKSVGELPPGSIVYADERFYCLAENGAMMLQQLTGEGFKTVGSFRLTEGKDAWAHPVICKGRLFLRYHDTLFCYDIRK